MAGESGACAYMGCMQSFPAHSSPHQMLALPYGTPNPFFVAYFVLNRSSCVASRQDRNCTGCVTSFAEGSQLVEIWAGWLAGLVTLWIMGVIVGLVGVVVAMRARSMAMRSVPVHEVMPSWPLCRRMKIGCQPGLVVAGWACPDDLARRRHVVVPLELLAPERQSDLELALAHELAHIKRRDLNWNWLPTLARVLFFFNPLVWVTGRELGIAQEMACDEMAVHATRAGVARYGRVLLTMIRPNQRPAPCGKWRRHLQGRLPR